LINLEICNEQQVTLMKYLKPIIISLCSLPFMMIGADKFLSFIEPPCSLQDDISPIVWRIIGVLQMAAGILLWLPKFRKFVVGFFFIFMIVFIGVHLSQGTKDIGGAAFMAVLLGVLVWNPPFLNDKN